MTGPGDIFLRSADGDFRFGPARRDHQLGEMLLANRLRHQKAPQRRGVFHRGGKPDAAMTGREGGEPRQPQRQQVAALGIVECVQFVQHHRLQILKQLRRPRMRHQQRQLFRRGQQYVRRDMALALAPRQWRVAGAGFDAHIQRHLCHWRFQVAGDIHCQGLQRRDVERVQAGFADAFLFVGKVNQTGQETSQSLAAAGWRHQQHAVTAPGMVHQRQLVRAGRPAARLEPGFEKRRQHGRPLCHGPARRRRLKTRPIAVFMPPPAGVPVRLPGCRRNCRPPARCRSG